MAETSLRRLTVEYLSVAALLAGSSLASHLIASHTLESHRSDAHLVNLSGRQRMLCERIAMLSLRLTSPAYKSERRKTREELRQAVGLMERSHGELVGRRGPFLEERVHYFLAEASALAREPDAGLHAGNPRAARVFKEALGALVVNLDRAVNEVQREADARVSRLDLLQKGALAASLTVLLLAVLLVFRPMAARVVEEQEELKSLNATLERRVLERSRQIAHLQDTYFHHINHEMRTPLACVHASVAGLAEILGRRLSAQETALLGIARRNTAHLNAMIDDLLALTGAELGRLKIERKPFSVPQLLHEVTDSLQLVAAPKGIFIDVASDQKLPTVLADQERVRQVVVNLLGNAIKFTPERGRINVAVQPCAEAPGFLAVSVSDTGPGIKPEELDRIFERRYQTEEGRRAGLRGLGLGLFICRELVTAQGGRIWARSEPGRGSVFTFTLPLAPSAA